MEAQVSLAGVSDRGGQGYRERASSHLGARPRSPRSPPAALGALDRYNTCRRVLGPRVTKVGLININKMNARNFGPELRQIPRAPIPIPTNICRNKFRPIPRFCGKGPPHCSDYLSLDTLAGSKTNSRRLPAAGPAQGRQLFRAGRKSCGRGIPWGTAGGPRGGAGPGAPGSQLGSPGQHVGFSGMRPQNARGGPGSGGAAPGAVRKSAGGGAQTAPLRLPSRPPPRAGATSVRPWPRSAGLAAPAPAGGGGGGGGGRGKGGPGRNPRGFPRRLPGVFVWESSTSPFTAGSRRTARRGTWQSLAGHFLDRMGPPPAPCAPGTKPRGCTALEALPSRLSDRSPPTSGPTPGVLGPHSGKAQMLSWGTELGTRGARPRPPARPPGDAPWDPAPATFPAGPEIGPEPGPARRQTNAASFCLGTGPKLSPSKLKK